MKQSKTPPWEPLDGDNPWPRSSGFRKEFGKTAEDLVSDWLIAHGYLILERNWRWHRFELDIVARRESRWVVVEVKGRSRITWDPSDPESVIRACLTRQQENRIRYALDAWARYKKLKAPIGIYLAVVIHGEIQWYLIDDG